jgi:2'-hydroxyisoflavone reductase
VQTVDGRDLGAFARTCLEKGLSGAFNAAGHRVTWKEFLAALGVSDPVWMSAKDLEAGSVPLPLYCPDGRPYSGLMNVSAAKAQAAGLTLTPLLQTIADTRAWLKTQAFEPMLTPEREAELIGTAR